MVHTRERKEENRGLEAGLLKEQTECRGVKESRNQIVDMMEERLIQ